METAALELRRLYFDGAICIYVQYMCMYVHIAPSKYNSRNSKPAVSTRDVCILYLFCLLDEKIHTYQQR